MLRDYLGKFFLGKFFSDASILSDPMTAFTLLAEDF
jgi:hypothetical protein